MNNGAIYGVFIVLMLSSGLLMAAMASVIELLALSVFVYALFRHIKYVRSQVPYLSYGKALLSGLMVSLFIGVITGFFVYMWYSFDPDALKRAHELELAVGKQFKNMMDDHEYGKFMQEMAENATPLSYGLKELNARVFIGFIISLVAAIFLKSKKAEDQQVQ